jgi:hypothetical protein
MASSFLNQSQLKRILSKDNIIKYSLIWSIISIAIYVIFSGPMTGADRPSWYRFLTAYALQIPPVVISGLFCLRNGLSRKMVSESKVWLLIGIALMCFSIGNVFFSSWELVWHLNSTGCLGDPFFVVFYVLLLFAVAMAIYQRKIRPNIWQWLAVLFIGAYAVGLANIILEPVAEKAVITEIASSNEAEKPVVTEEVKYAPDVPMWVQSVDEIIKPYGKNLNMFYVWCDVVLFCLAAIMLFDSWHTKLAIPWRLNALAIFFIYVADAWYAYAGNRVTDYQAGFMLEVFWILGMLQFGIAAVIEHDQTIAVPPQNELLNY